MCTLHAVQAACVERPDGEYAGTEHVTSNGTAADSAEEEDVRPAQAELTAEQGLKHLLLTVDVERLYRLVNLRHPLA